MTPPTEGPSTAGGSLAGGSAAGGSLADRLPGGERLQKVLARVGFGSRRTCEGLIADGRVSVNGLPARLGQRIDPRACTVRVDGEEIGMLPDLVYYLLNKPAGVVTTAQDPQGRPVVVDLVPAVPRVFPVGRLDAETEGLLILTNDGPLAQRLTHPTVGVEKEYLAQLVGNPSPGALRRLRKGVELDDGVTRNARVSVVGPETIRIVLREGRNREVRRMCAEVGHPVRRLVRTRIGALSEASLAPGQWRTLSLAEVRRLGRAQGEGAQG